MTHSFLLKYILIIIFGTLIECKSIAKVTDTQNVQILFKITMFISDRFVHLVGQMFTTPKIINKLPMI